MDSNNESIYNIYFFENILSNIVIAYQHFIGIMEYRHQVAFYMTLKSTNLAP